MTDEPASPSKRDEARAAAKRRRTKGLDRREAIFDLFVSGFSHQQIAKALDASTSTVRRILDTAVAERQLDAPERFARVQIARLSKALSHADLKLEQGDIRAFTPYLKIVAALDRYHRLDARGLPQRLAHTEDVLSAPAPLLALPGPAPTDPAPDEEVADFGA
ncbi:MAG: helix-turn-helix domain-containing protein [Roseiarcus sp.]|uniref:helix-turn-helix domain-containing protein n=1 Tax=Roseiarcus sp. TaxID=1969460 RepID=UPI003C5EBFCE